MLLFDQNLPPSLVDSLQECFPNCVHVQNVGLSRAADDTIWSYAVERHLVIVTKDADFRQRSFLEGHPPKIIWVALGNCSTAAIENLLRNREENIQAFLSDEQSSFLSLS